MTFNEGDICLTVYAAAFPQGDLLGFLKVTPEGQLEGEYRFRYHLDNKLFDSEDKKSFYRVGPTPDSEDARRSLRKALERVFTQPPLTGTKIIDVNSSDYNKLREALESISGMKLGARAMGPKA